jgi:hypothetical protein
MRSARVLPVRGEHEGPHQHRPCRPNPARTSFYAMICMLTSGCRHGVSVRGEHRGVGAARGGDVRVAAVVLPHAA